MKKTILLLGVGILLVVLVYFFFVKDWTMSAMDRVENNFGSSIEKAAQQYGINEAYLKALCVLESGGKKNSKRFEPKIYAKLKQVQQGKMNQLEGITKNDLKDTDDAGLRNLATSWGPFQLMGYKCFLLGIKVKDIRGEDAVDWGVRWVNLTYGDYVKSGKYEDAFHIHNTGSPLPKNGKPRTYHADYIPNGMKHMRMFDKK
jgi:hypothetical protein